MIPINDTIPHREFPFVTWFLILANGLVFLYETSLSELALTRFFHFYGMVPARLTDPTWAALHEVSRLSLIPFITSIFLHGSWLHFFINVWTLWIFGDNVEDRMGKISFLIFYILCGVLGNIAHLLMNFRSPVPTIGASGAIAAVMGAYMWLFPRAKIVVLVPVFFIPYFLEVPAFFYIGIWFLFQVFSGVTSLAAPGASGEIAWWAHIGGFLVGIFLLPIFKKRQATYSKHSPFRVDRLPYSLPSAGKGR
ncbi:MAG: rhomboid family intramembrane serine protease [Candidatus Aureabacteria bacterium]|nr:rhomboid family intramembrane serine protease [Candidatus Auribacterota bacterium]